MNSSPYCTDRPAISVIYSQYFRYFRSGKFSPPSFADWKVLEAQLLALNGHNIRAVVVGAGIPYGNGDTILRDYLRVAWSSPEKLRVIATGENVVPMIHVRDLARLCRYIAYDPEELTKTYYIAADGADTTQKEMIASMLNEFQVRDD